MAISKCELNHFTRPARFLPRKFPGKILRLILAAILGVGGYILTQETDARSDLTVSLKASTPTAPRQDVSLSTTVKNAGPGSAPPSSCDVIIRNARPPRQELRRYEETIPPLDPGDTFTFTRTVKPGLGAYEVCAIVDPKNLVVEADETNNRYCETITGK